MRALSTFPVSVKVPDQVPFMWRCGFNALSVTHVATRKALEQNRLAAVSVYMQPVGNGQEIPAGTRPFVRRGAESPVA